MTLVARMSSSGCHEASCRKWWQQSRNNLVTIIQQSFKNGLIIVRQSFEMRLTIAQQSFNSRSKIV